MTDITKLAFAPTHEWVNDLGDGTALVGISDQAQELLGDMVYIELPTVGDIFDSGDDVAVAESVKAASDIYSPVSGEILEVNEALENTPEIINNDAYVEGWLYKIKLSEPNELNNLLSYNGYVESL